MGVGWEGCRKLGEGARKAGKYWDRTAGSGSQVTGIMEPQYRVLECPVVTGPVWHSEPQGTRQAQVRGAAGICCPAINTRCPYEAGPAALAGAAPVTARPAPPLHPHPRVPRAPHALLQAHLCAQVRNACVCKVMHTPAHVSHSCLRSPGHTHTHTHTAAPLHARAAAPLHTHTHTHAAPLHAGQKHKRSRARAPTTPCTRARASPSLPPLRRPLAVGGRPRQHRHGDAGRAAAPAR